MEGTAQLRAIAAFYRADAELARHLPERPRFTDEVCVVACGQEGIVFVSAAGSRLVKGAAAPAMMDLLPHLSGERTLQELCTSCPSLRPDQVFDLICFLWHMDLLEEGRDPRERYFDRQALAYTGTLLGVSEAKRNRHEALSRYRQSLVGVQGAEQEASAELCAALQRDGVRCTGAADGPKPADLTILIQGPESPRSRRVAELSACIDEGTAVLVVFVADSLLQVGPLLNGVHRCTAEYIEELRGLAPDLCTASSAWVRTAAPLITLHVVNYLMGLSKGALQNLFVRYTSSGEGLATSTQLVPLVFGAHSSAPNLGSRWWDSPLWKLHEVSSLRAAGGDSPLAYRSHYNAHNVALHSRAISASEGGIASRDLDAAPAHPARLDESSLLSILFLGAGFVSAAGRARRVAPSGGDLRSCEMFVYARSVHGLAEGLYRYDGHSHSLDKIAGEEARGEICSRLRLRELPDCLLFALANLGRVRQKYGMRGYRIVHYDSGVSTAFAQLRAAFLGLRCDSLPELDADLLQPYLHPQLGTRRFLTACAVAIRSAGQTTGERAGEAPFTDELELLLRDSSRNADRLRGPALELPVHLRHRGRWSEVLAELLHRRATRVFQERALLPAHSKSLSHVLQCALDYTRCGALAGLHAFVIEAQDDRALPSRITRFAAGVAPQVIPPTALHSRMPPLLGQYFPNRAPFLVIVGANLAQDIRRQDNAANRYGLHLAGFVVGHLWIATQLLGLAGTAIGAVLLDAVCAATGANGYDEAPLLAFCAGSPLPDPVQARRSERQPAGISE